MNHELKLVSDWLKANRLSLNVYKSKLIIFKSKQKQFDNDNFLIKINDCKIEFTDKTSSIILRQKSVMEIPENQLNKTVDLTFF